MAWEVGEAPECSNPSSLFLLLLPYTDQLPVPKAIGAYQIDKERSLRTKKLGLDKMLKHKCQRTFWPLLKLFQNSAVWHLEGSQGEQWLMEAEVFQETFSNWRKQINHSSSGRKKGVHAMGSCLTWVEERMFSEEQSCPQFYLRLWTSSSQRMGNIAESYRPFLMTSLPSRGPRTGSMDSSKFSIITTSPASRACSMIWRYLGRKSVSKSLWQGIESEEI